MPQIPWSPAEIFEKSQFILALAGIVGNLTHSPTRIRVALSPFLAPLGAIKPMHRHVVAACLSFVVPLVCVSSNHAGSIDLKNAPALTSDDFTRTDEGVTWTFSTINALIGNNWRVSGDENYLSFGGGSGSTLIMDFSADVDSELVSYTIGCGLCVNDPMFTITDQSTNTVISTGNSGGIGDGITVDFAGQPLAITAGTTYRFEVTNGGAAVQSNFDTWQFNVVPEPSGLAIAGVFGIALWIRRRQG